MICRKNDVYQINYYLFIIINIINKNENYVPNIYPDSRVMTIQLIFFRIRTLAD